jgi:hypothetical protein
MRFLLFGDRTCPMRNIPGVHVDPRLQSRIVKSPLLNLDGDSRL